MNIFYTAFYCFYCWLWKNNWLLGARNIFWLPCVRLVFHSYRHQSYENYISGTWVLNQFISLLFKPMTCICFVLFFFVSKMELKVVPASRFLCTGSLRSSIQEVFCKNGFLKNFAKFTGKYLYQCLSFNKASGLILQLYWKRDSDKGVLSCESFENFTVLKYFIISQQIH